MAGPEGTPRAIAEQKIRRRLKTSKRWQRVVVAASMTAGIAGGAGVIPQEAALVTTVVASAGAIAERSNARRRSAGIVYDYAVDRALEQGNLEVASPHTRTLLVQNGDDFEEWEIRDPRAIPYMTDTDLVSPVLSAAGGFGGGGILGMALSQDVIDPALAVFGGLASSLGPLVHVADGYMVYDRLQQTYVRQLDNIDGGVVFDPGNS